MHHTTSAISSSLNNLCLSTLVGTVLLTGIACSSNKLPSASQPLFTSSVLTPANSFTSGAEGPAVDKAGTIYAVNYHHQGTIGQIFPSGESHILVELANGSIGNGIRFNSRGEMLIADYTNHNILKVDLATKQVTVFAHEPRMNQPNDLAIDSKDRLYASDPNWKEGSGKLWRIDTDGSTTLLADSMGTTNGIEVSPDEHILYVNESVQRKVWVFDLSAEGKISNKRLLIEFADFGMDGMRCDREGNLYITRHGKGTVVKVSPQGRIIQEIVLVGKNPSNIAFGGQDGHIAYITLQDQGNMEYFRVDLPGREWQMLQK
ncbi:SMP-30/gluconolactonase/LRE family protein [Rhodocytophaga rosea]|uniref:SMP-30/gluconolactonase/LRE family protein n=1 Tax=Rhodocytophaga rosea TaxID=2704465 RepID=A0A6C0GU36_9BACT|nr:SMP-30/gluconolactonase/LRE family protein [Rhodocytophaga rosea]QHT71709.1 SMP-30/gluconolactonase/LRE family protein [Rhodocytophaga rosea]